MALWYIEFLLVYRYIAVSRVLVCQIGEGPFSKTIVVTLESSDVSFSGKKKDKRMEYYYCGRPRVPDMSTFGSAMI